MSTNKKGVSRGSAQPPAGTEEVVHRGISWRQAGPDRLYWYNEGLARWVLWSAGQDAPPVPPGWALAGGASGERARAAETGPRDTPARSGAATASARADGARGPAGQGGQPGRPARTGEAPAREPRTRDVEARRTGSGGTGPGEVRRRAAGSPSVPERRNGAQDVASDQGAHAPAQPSEHGGLLRYMPDNAMARRQSMASPYRWVPLLIVVAIVVLALYQATRSPARATPKEIAAAQALEGKCLAHEPGHPETYSTVPVRCSLSSAAVKVVAVVFTGKATSCPRGSLYAQVAKPGVVGEPFECLQPLGHGG